MKLSDITCPHCSKKNTWTDKNAFRPFCSERCKLIDLGNWADETHRIPGDQKEEDTLVEDEEVKGQKEED